tara:strand:+ start:766 stop:1053 length:288 start_codon:yes stop_codon:yes gene_type:complete
MLLTNISGRKYLQGIDKDGLVWKQFELDYHNFSDKRRCCYCGKEMQFGWNSNNQYVCDSEVEYEGKNSYFFQEELTESKYIDSIISTAVSNNWWR